MVRAADTFKYLNTGRARPYSDQPSVLLRARVAQLKTDIRAGIDEMTALRAELALRAEAAAAEPALPDPPEYMTVSEAGIGHCTVDCRCGAHWDSLTVPMARNVLQHLAKTHHGPGCCEHRWPRHDTDPGKPAAVAV